MADEKDKAQEQKKAEAGGTSQDNDQSSGYGSSGGNAGAGKSGKENMGSEKPTDDERMGSQKAGS